MSWTGMGGSPGCDDRGTALKAVRRPLLRQVDHEGAYHHR